MIFAALYMLWSFQKAFTGRAKGAVAKMKDLPAEMGGSGQTLAE